MDAAQTSASAVEQEDSLLAVAAAHSLALIAVNNPEPDPTEYATTVEALDVALQQLEGVKRRGLYEHSETFGRLLLRLRTKRDEFSRARAEALGKQRRDGRSDKGRRSEPARSLRHVR